MEAHAQAARRLALRIGYASIALLTLVHWSDHIPTPLVVLCVLAQLLHLHIIRANPTWPFTVPFSPAPAVASGGRIARPTAPLAACTYCAFALTIVVHFAMAHTLFVRRRQWAAHRIDLQAGRTYSPLLPGGRLDWDLYDQPDARRAATTAAAAPPAPLSGSEALTLFLCGVWATPIVAFLGVCAAMQASLPFAA